MVREQLLVFCVLGLVCLGAVQCRSKNSGIKESFKYSSIRCRKHSAVLTDFGGKGDGKTSNTAAFKTAIHHLSKLAPFGGALLLVPPGKWLTGPFNLTSNFTLFLHKDAVILASQDESDWPLIDPLPSYGRGRDAPGGRFCSLISGSHLKDVAITGNNGTIDGQGSSWWKKFRSKRLKNTRPYLIELMYSEQIQISNITLINSPSWHVHPVYSRDIIIQGLTILASIHSPNTDGINPDSCNNTRIEDCYIVSGDDCIAVKSGWDEYGIKVGMPTMELIIRRLTCISPFSAGIALGSEMSGGIQDVRAEDITAINTESGVRIKTARGRGGYINDIFVKGMTMENMKYAFWMSGAYGSHPDDHYDPKALPAVHKIIYMDMVAKNVTTAAGLLSGIDTNHPFTGICISNVNIQMSSSSKKKKPWKCSDIKGISSEVTPQPCEQFISKVLHCPFPTDTLAIDNVRLKTCSI